MEIMSIINCCFPNKNHANSFVKEIALHENDNKTENIESIQKKNQESQKYIDNVKTNSSVNDSNYSSQMNQREIKKAHSQKVQFNIAAITLASPEQDTNNRKIKGKPQSCLKVSVKEKLEKILENPELKPCETKSSFSEFEKLSKNIYSDTNSIVGDKLNTDYFPSFRVISDDDLTRSNYLVINEIEGNLLKSSTLTINAQGLIGGLRKKLDGIVYFGPVKESGDCIVNDFILDIDSKNPHKHTFIIFFDKDLNKFFIKSDKDKDNGVFPIVLIRLESKQKLRKKQIFRIGDVYIQVQTDEQNLIEITQLKADQKENEIFKFSPKETPLNIGRNKDCTIKFKDQKSFSRIQCTFYYEDGFWYIKDGSIQKGSTNGTWIYAQYRHEIINKTIVRVHHSVFEIEVHSRGV